MSVGPAPFARASPESGERPFDRASSVENRWKTRIGSSDDRTVTAEPSRIRLVRLAIAASTNSGDATAKSGR